MKNISLAPRSKADGIRPQYSDSQILSEKSFGSVRFMGCRRASGKNPVRLDRMVLLIQWPVCSLSALLIAMTASAQQIVNLGTISGYEQPQPRDMSANGAVVVGHCYNRTQDSNTAFRWTASTGMQSLASLPGATDTYAFAVNADGSTTAGRSWLPTAHAFHAVRWTESGAQDLGLLPGASAALACDLSADGSIVVGYCMFPTGLNRAFKWTSSQGMQDLGTLPGDESSIAYSVSADGTTIVGASGYPNYDRAWRWTEATGLRQVPGLPTPNGGSSFARAVSADGSIVAGYTDYPGVSLGFVWSASGGTRGIEESISYPYTYPFAISDGGTTLVGAFGTGSDYRAFIWNAQSGVSDLRNYLMARGVNLEAWSALTQATSTSADGRYVVGIGTVAGAVAAYWCDTGPAPCLADLVLADRQVNGADLGALLSQWGPANQNTTSDINRDGVVNGADLGSLLNAWGPCPN